MLRVYSNMRIKNFRTFQDLEVNFSPVTIISGRNNTGKTALLEAVFLNAAGPLAAATALATLYGARGQGPIVLSGNDSGIIWDSLFHDYDIRHPVQLHGIFDNEAVEVELSNIEGSAAAALSSQPVGDTGQSFSQSISVRFKRGKSNAKRYTQTATQQPFGQPFTGIVNIQIGGISLQLKPSAEPFLQARYLASKTRSSQAELAERYSALRVGGRSADLLSSIKEIEPRLRTLEVLVRNGQPMLHADIGGPDLLPLPLFGEGMVAAVDFMSAIYQSKGSVVFIDEIENGIHYTVLEKIWWQVKRAAQRTGTQVIATTHSRECLEAAMAAFRKESHDLGLLRLWRDSRDNGQVAAVKYSASELKDALDLNLDVR